MEVTPLPTSASGLGSPPPHLHRDSAQVRETASKLPAAPSAGSNAAAPSAGSGSRPVQPRLLAPPAETHAHSPGMPPPTKSAAKAWAGGRLLAHADGHKEARLRGSDEVEWEATMQAPHRRLRLGLRVL